MRREWLLSVGAVALAFLGSQHHNIMMVLVALGLGSAGMNLMTELPFVRLAMLALSLVMGCGDCVSDFKVGVSFRYAPRWFALHSPNHRYRRMVRTAIWFVVSATMEKPFRKDLSHLSWDEVWVQQVGRAALIPDWLNALRIKRGDRVLEIGAGPGFVSFALADRVGPTGVVYALDRSAEALAQLERRQKERGIGHIQRIAADAATLQSKGLEASSALITMVLHHADDPAEILRNIVRFVPPGAPVVIGEFHPEGPCTSGPPRNHRLAPEKVQEWCKNAGLAVVGYQRQSPEHYLVIAQLDR
jgi:ubiquinone/menaquinone biosynthesis C-methylase UbiE